MKIIKLPKIFKLQHHNIGEIINSLNRIVKPLNEEIALDFSEIQEMSKGDFMVLLAQIEKSVQTKKNKVYRHGKFPVSKEIKELLKGIAVHHVNKSLNVSDVNAPGKEKENHINPELIDSIVSDLRKIGIKEYYYPFNTFLTELIGNAVEHGIKNREINWWLTHEIDRSSKQCRYTFVDMGLGIIGSHRKAGLPIRYLFLRKKHVVINALYGTLPSSTKQPNRGRGLPQLRDLIEKEIVSDLVLITNSVLLQYKDNAFVSRVIPNFVGTYFSWTIDQSNFHKWTSIQ